MTEVKRETFLQKARKAQKKSILKEISFVKLGVNSKIPIASHTNWQNEKCPYEKIKNYKGNLGLATGNISNSLYVLDWDFRDGQKEEGFKIIFNEFKKRFPTISNTYIVSTPHGYHLYYKLEGNPHGNTSQNNGGYSKTLKSFIGSNSVRFGKYLKGFDSRGDGGYVVVPPSEVDGLKYEIYNDVEPVSILQKSFYREMFDFFKEKDKQAHTMRKAFVDIAMGKLNPQTYKQETGMKEHVYWKEFYHEAYSCLGVLPEDLFDGLEVKNEGFNREKAITQLNNTKNSLYILNGKRMTKEKYKEYFPKYNRITEVNNLFEKEKTYDFWDLELHKKYKDKTGLKAIWGSKDDPNCTKDYLKWFKRNYNTEDDVKKEEIKEPTELDEASEDEKEYVEKLLNSENKFEMITKILDYGLVNEKENKFLVFLLTIGAYFGITFIILLICESGAGKTELQKNIEKRLPDDHVLYLTDNSDKALIHYNWTNELFIFISEIQRSEKVQEMLKNFREGDKGIVYMVTIKNLETNEYDVKEINIGKKTIIGTTTDEFVNIELLNGAWRFEMDPSALQNEAVVDDIIEKSENRIEYRKKIEIGKKQNQIIKLCLLTLQKEVDYNEIEIPFFRLLKEYLNFRTPKIRRQTKDLKKLLEIITNCNHRLRENYKKNDYKVLLCHPNDFKIFLDKAYNSIKNIIGNITPIMLKILKRMDILKKEESYWAGLDLLYEDFCLHEGYDKDLRNYRDLLNILSTRTPYLKKKKDDKDKRKNIYSIVGMPELKEIENIDMLLDEALEIYNERIEELKNDKDVEFFKKNIKIQFK